MASSTSVRGANRKFRLFASGPWLPNGKHLIDLVLRFVNAITFMTCTSLL